jgi:hypothetical protein
MERAVGSVDLRIRLKSYLYDGSSIVTSSTPSVTLRGYRMSTRRYDYELREETTSCSAGTGTQRADAVR